MAEILFSRYDIFTSKKIQTRTITNLSPSEIEKQYGNRVRSRLREMNNLIGFEKRLKIKGFNNLVNKSKPVKTNHYKLFSNLVN